MTVFALSSDIFIDIAQSGHDLVELTQGLLIEMIPAMKRRGARAAILRPGAGRSEYYRQAGRIATLTGDARQRGHAIRVIKETIALGAELGSRAIILECGQTGVDSGLDGLAGIRLGLATGAGIHEFPDRQDLRELFGTFDHTLGYWHDWSKASFGERYGFGDHGSRLACFRDRTIGATLNAAASGAPNVRRNALPDLSLVSELLPEETFKVIGPGIASTPHQVRSMVNEMLKAGVA